MQGAQRWIERRTKDIGDKSNAKNRRWSLHGGCTSRNGIGHSP